LPTARGADTAGRIAFRSWGRSRAVNATSRTPRPIFRTAAISVDRRKRAAFMPARSFRRRSVASVHARDVVPTPCGRPSSSSARENHARARGDASSADTCASRTVPSPRKKWTMNEQWIVYLCEKVYQCDCATVPWLPAGGSSSSSRRCGGISRDRVVGSVVVVERREGEPLNLKQLWHAALGELQLGLTKANYDTWFKDTAIVSEEDDVYCVGVPNAFAREWLENKYRQQVRDALRHLVVRTVDVRFVTLTAASVLSDRSVADGGAGSPATTSAAPAQDRRDATAAALLNARYTFSTFVVGSNNRLAHAAALSVAERPGHSYNPLFIYGGSGLGKTHLMHAIGHAVISRHPKKRVAY